MNDITTSEMGRLGEDFRHWPIGVETTQEPVETDYGHEPQIEHQPVPFTLTQFAIAAILTALAAGAVAAWAPYP